MKTAADVAVVGAGAAGLMAAIQARAAAPAIDVLLLDSRRRIGAKILISGGTRCNVTNVRVTPSDYRGAPAHFVKHVLAAFTPEQTIAFFERIGVRLVLEPTGKYFPTTHSGKTVLEALVRELGRAGARLETGVKVRRVDPAEGGFVLRGEAEDGPFECAARRLILATGGLSYPETGSDGTGLRIARTLGHTIVDTVPALTPFTTADRDWAELSGVTLEARLELYAGGRKEAEASGSFLFTHVGFSGPVALDLSRHWARVPADARPEVFVDFAPEETEDSLRAKFDACRAERPSRTLSAFLEKDLRLPASFAQVFLRKAGARGDAPVGQATREERAAVVRGLRRFPLSVNGTLGYKKAEVTAGGVDVSEVRAATMESKIVPGLYFTGEILDVDGRIGGFNFQWAWSSGTVAGRGAAKALP